MLKILHHDPEYAIGTLDRVILTLWRGDADADAFVRLNPVYDRMAAEHDAFAFFTVMTAEAKTPTEAGRRALSELLKRHENRIKGAAVTVEGSGFKGAAVRSAITGLSMLARMPYPHKTFSSVDDATPWFVEQVQLGIGAADMRAAIAKLRETA